MNDKTILTNHSQIPYSIEPLVLDVVHDTDFQHTYFHTFDPTHSFHIPF